VGILSVFTEHATLTGYPPYHVLPCQQLYTLVTEHEHDIDRQRAPRVVMATATGGNKQRPIHVALERILGTVRFVS